MPKCSNCDLYPWSLDSNPGELPLMKCHKSLEARKWTKDSIQTEHNCPLFQGPMAEPSVEGPVTFEPSSDPKLDKLKKKASDLGIEYSDGVTESQLIKMVKDHLRG